MFPYRQGPGEQCRGRGGGERPAGAGEHACANKKTRAHPRAHFGRQRPAARRQPRLAALLLALSALAAPAAAEGRLDLIETRGRLIVGVKADYPPWGTVAPDGSIVGLEPDLARDLAGRLGVELELVPVTSANRLGRLDQGVVDVVIATTGDTVERRTQADLVQPHYYASGVNLLAREGSPFAEWGSLRGRPVCLTEGAWFNRALTERYLIDPVVLPGTRDTALALRDGRCVGWAYDDTVLAQFLAEPRWADYRLALPTVLRTPWAVAVARGEGHGPLGRAVADAVADWHRTGLLAELGAKWDLPPSDFLAEQTALWSAVGDGAPVCARNAAGAFPAACLAGEVARAGGAATALPAWATRLEALTGLDPAPLLDPFTRTRLLRGLGLTLGLSLAAIVGSLALGTLFALALAGRRRLLRAPVRALVSVARMTPPILQLYILFFGLGGLLAAEGLTLPGFLVASLVFSLYAGATDAVLLDAALAQLRAERPGEPVPRLLPSAVERAYEGLVSTSVNIVKAAGMASTIAVAELVSSVNTAVAEGADAWTMMNLLLLFYFLFVLAVLGGLHAAKGAVLAWTRP